MEARCLFLFGGCSKTHFFQNLTSFKVGYLTLNPYINDGFYDIEYLNRQEAIFENEYIRHIRFNNALHIIIEGGKNKAVIYKENHTMETQVSEEE